MPKALITGVTGQDGSYLAEFLLAKGYEVHGIIRRTSSFSTARIEHIYADPHEPDERLRLHYGDLNDASSLQRVLATVEPDEVYNLGAQSHVRVSFEVPEYTVGHRGRHASAARGNAQPRDVPSILPGVVERDVRQGRRDAADGAHPVLPALAVRVREGVRALRHGELPGELRAARL